MQINWPLITILFCLSLPGVIIAMPRLINLLLHDNSEELRRRVSRLAITQTLIMVFVMSFTGSALSTQTGLNAPLLDALFQGQPVLNKMQDLLLPVFLYTLGGLFIFFVLYYGLVASVLDEGTLQVMKKMRAALRLDGCILYGGVVEDILVRWGLMNLVSFFALLFAKQKTPAVMWWSIFISGLLFSLSQLPAYLAAGCQPSRRFIYSILLLGLWQAVLFGWLFWQYGLVAAIVAHMLFHLGWSLYDKA
jgi:hypothetical protein